MLKFAKREPIPGPDDPTEDDCWPITKCIWCYTPILWVDKVWVAETDNDIQVAGTGEYQYAVCEKEPCAKHTDKQNEKQARKRIRHSIRLRQSIANHEGAEGELERDHNGRVKAKSQGNILVALGRLGVSLAHDTFSDTLLVIREGKASPLDDAILDRLWLEIDQEWQFQPSMEFFMRVVKDAARQAQFHPVCDYLDSLRWDGTARINTWLQDYAGAEDTKYTRAVSALVLLAAVRRVRTPGCKFDEMLVLETPVQGKDKSTTIRALCPKQDWFSDDLPLNVDSKQLIERTSGKWIIEAAELAGMRKSQAEHLKSLLSRQVDGPVRLAYARLPVEVKRQFIVIGTTNSSAYLKDPTGNRRFWPVQVHRFDVPGLQAVRDQLWAEAAHREAQGESIRLDSQLWADAGTQQESRRTEDPWEVLLGEKFVAERMRITDEAAWLELGLPVGHRSEEMASRLHTTMQRLGFRRGTITPRKDEGGGNAKKGWIRDPEELFDGCGMEKQVVRVYVVDTTLTDPKEGRIAVLQVVTKP